MDLGLQDAHVLITGASGGIGVEIARLFLCACLSTNGMWNSPSQLVFISSERQGDCALQYQLKNAGTLVNRVWQVVSPLRSSVFVQRDRGRGAFFQCYCQVRTGPGRSREPWILGAGRYAFS